MNLENTIEITGVDLVKLTQEAYELSIPLGLGFLHYKSGGLSKEEAQKYVDIWKKDKTFALSLDYVNGRACKLDVVREEGKLFISKRWYDHSKEQLKSLLESVGIDT